MTNKPLDKTEMVAILEDIARNSGNAAARIAAIKALREIQNDGKPVSEAFAQLDELAGRSFIRTKN